MPHLAQHVCQDLLTQGLSIAQTSDLDLQVAFNRPVCMEDHCRLIQSSLDCFTIMRAHASCINAAIGRYCTIGAYVSIGGIEQNLQQAALSPVFHGNAFSFVGHTAPQTSPYIDKPYRQPLQCTDQPFSYVSIGHDVWIGDYASLSKTVNIGHGAIIRQGAVISQDIPPYAIVSSTGTITGQRYDDETIADLLEIEWWNYNLPEMLKQGHKVQLDDIKAFISFFRDLDPQQLIKAPEKWVLCDVANQEFINNLPLQEQEGQFTLAKL